jgi:hypothetical protein
VPQSTPNQPCQTWRQSRWRPCGLLRSERMLGHRRIAGGGSPAAGPGGSCCIPAAQRRAAARRCAARRGPLQAPGPMP